MQRYGAASPAPSRRSPSRTGDATPLLSTARRTRRRLRRPARRCRGRRTRLAARPAHPVPADGQGRHRPRRQDLHARRRRRRPINDQAADDRVLRADRRRRDPRAAGAAPHLAATGRLRVELSAELGHPVQINSYITPAANRGFAPHYDVHDVFVLQVEGRKRWRIHAPVVADPLDNQPWEQYRDAVAARAQGEPLIDTVLEPGDALYLPRGTIHSAEALGETSIHLTVGVHPRHPLPARAATARARAGRAGAARVAADGRRPVRPGRARRRTWRRPCRALTDHARRRRCGRRCPARRRPADDLTRPEPVGPLAQLRAAEARTRDRVAVARRPAPPHREDTEQLTLTVLDRTLTLPAVAAAALKTVLAGEPFRTRDLPGLDADEQLTLARRLMRESVIVRAGDAAADAEGDAGPLRVPCRRARRSDARHCVPREPHPARRATRPVGAGRAHRVRLRPPGGA